ncbi:MAG: carbohydrate binding family 9 domain-containing protein [Acidobacteria bacterium]|nr:carbohydrate binding family 9 domain-containing protein [Acidobacteriota bacterium]
MKANKERIVASWIGLILLCALALPAAKAVANPAGPAAPVPIHRTETPPVIDGRLDDAVWQNATRFDNFLTFKPDYGKPTSEKTAVLMIYDRTYIYFAFDCQDSDPGKIKAAMAKRDGIDMDDWIGVVLDTFGDKQGGYLFEVNPLGVQMDGRINADGNGDASFDTVWESKGCIHDKGYSAEMAIPFKSLRYPFKKQITMGLLVSRFIGRKSEQTSFPELSPEGGAIMTQAQRIELSDVKFERPVEFIPALTYDQGSSHSEGEMRSTGRNTDFSLTGKLGLTSNLTLDATYNPDFSQIETDAGQIDVNLRYSIYYPEKRPFFLEGMENFNFATAMEANTIGAIVYTRSITDPLLGVKLTGKIGGQNVLSGIFALDEYPGRLAAEAGDLDLAGRDARFTILRYKRQMSQDSYVGGFFTDRSFAGTGNSVGGIDGRWRLNNTSYFEYSFFKSFNRELDAGRDSQGHALGLRYYFSNRHWDVDLGFFDLSDDFRIDTGYVTRTGITMVPAFVAYSLFPKSNFFQRLTAFWWSYHLLDKHSDLFETYNHLVLRLSMPRQTQVRFDAILGNEVFADQRFSLSGWRVRGVTQLLKQLYLEGGYRRSDRIYYDPQAPFQGRGSTADLFLLFQPFDKLSTSLGLSYYDISRSSNGEKIYDYTIWRSRTTLQVNRFLFFRAIVEYNNYWRKINADFLLGL